MEQKLEGKISYSESPAYAITKTLANKGYYIADYRGRAVSKPTDYGWGMVLGILEPREPVKIFGLPVWSKKALFIGRLAINCERFGAKENENWVLEVYGRDNVQKLTEIVKEHSEVKKVDLQVRLQQEQSELQYVDSGDMYG